MFLSSTAPARNFRLLPQVMNCSRAFPAAAIPACLAPREEVGCCVFLPNSARGGSDGRLKNLLPFFSLHTIFWLFPRHPCATSVMLTAPAKDVQEMHGVPWAAFLLTYPFAFSEKLFLLSPPRIFSLDAGSRFFFRGNLLAACFRFSSARFYTFLKFARECCSQRWTTSDPSGINSNSSPLKPTVGPSFLPDTAAGEQSSPRSARSQKEPFFPYRRNLGIDSS